MGLECRQLVISLESSRVLVSREPSGSSEGHGQARPVLIRGQPTADGSAPPGEGVLLPTKQWAMVLSSSHDVYSPATAAPPGETGRERV